MKRPKRIKRDGPSIPPNLSAEAAAWWTNIVENYQLQPWQIPTLTMAARCMDRISQAEKEIAEFGISFVDSRGERKKAPAVMVEREQKTIYARLVRELCLDTEPPKESRPPKLRYK